MARITRMAQVTIRSSWASMSALAWTVVLLLLVLVTAGLAQAVDNLLGGDEPLPPEVAFVPSIIEVNDSTIVVGFEVEDGYYLYRDKLAFNAQAQAGKQSGSLIDTLGPQTVIGDPIYQNAQKIEDDYFGEQFVFRQQTQITLPYTAAASSAQIDLAIKYQGCADIGLCYPPITTLLPVDLPARTTASVSSLAPPTSLTLPTPSNTTSSSTSLGDLLGSSDSQAEILPPEAAFLPQILSADGSQLTINWQIEPGYYLYRDKLSFSLQDTEHTRVVGTRISDGIEQHDEFFGLVQVLRESAQAQLQLDSSRDFAGGNQATLNIKYQGCADIGVCFPPSETALPVVFDKTSNTATAGVASSDTGSGGGSNTSNNGNTISALTKTVATETGGAQSEQDRLFSMLGSNSLWLNVATFFGLGLLLAFTPCVLPMVPILSSLIVGQGDTMNTGKAFRLSLVYVLVMACTYAVVGIFVGLSGYNVQAFLQNPWVLSAIAVLFVVLSLSMFGFYELQMPTGLQNKLTQWSNRQGGGQVSGVAAMGFISTLIVGPCVTAPLAGALIYIAKTGDALIGGAALFALGLGMGAPLLLIGTSAGKLIPRAGAWMNTTKHIFGILMLGMAIYMISRFIPSTVTMSLYGVLAIMSGVYLGATDTLTQDSKGWQRFGKGAGLVVSVYGLALLVGAFSGGGSYTTPLRGVTGGITSAANESQTHALPFQAIKGIDGLQQAVLQASSEGRPVMLDFYADWCISCKEMEAFTFTDSRVQNLLKDALVIQADVTANDSADQALLKRFDLFGPPGIIFYDANGNEIPAARVVGYMPADKFSAHLERFITTIGI